MQEFFRDIIAFFHDMRALDKWIIVASLFMIALTCLRIVIKLHVNAKKFKVKIVPIILFVIFLFLAIFIACC